MPNHSRLAHPSLQWSNKLTTNGYQAGQDCPARSKRLESIRRGQDWLKSWVLSKREIVHALTIIILGTKTPYKKNRTRACWNGLEIWTPKHLANIEIANIDQCPKTEASERSTDKMGNKAAATAAVCLDKFSTLQTHIDKRINRDITTCPAR